MIILIGASGGIGQELTKQLSQHHDVISTYNKNPIQLRSPRLQNIYLDILSEKQIIRFSEYVKKSCKNITLINLAAVSIDKLLIQTTPEEWRKAYTVNVESNFLLMKHFARQMISDEFGRLIMVSSIVSKQAPTGTSAYASSKAALEGLCRAAAHEYGRFNITSNILELGYFEQGLIKTLTAKGQKEILNRIPSKAFGRITNIASAIKFLIEADYVNGSIIQINGGIQC